MSANFPGTPFLPLHVSSYAISQYLLAIPVPFARTVAYYFIALDIANDLSGGGLESDPLRSELLGLSPPLLRPHIENIVHALMEIEEGPPRYATYGIVMTVIAENSFP